ANPDNAAYARGAGTFGEEAKQETLVSDVEEPVNLVTSAPQASAATASSLAPAGDLSGKGDDRLEPGDQQAALSPTTLQPRKVRTLTVRRDGTIVRSQDAETAAVPATADPAPIDGARTTGSLPVPQPRPDASGASATATVPLPTSLPATTPPPAPANTLPGVNLGQTVVPVPATDPVTTQSVAAVDDASSAPIALAPAPQVQPAAAAATQQAALGEWVVQISSQRSPEDAQASYRNLLNRFPSILEGRQMAIREADIPDRGVFYRVHIAAQSKEDATDFCQQLQSAGGACFVTR
ncbi:MAG: SPOR domain-containing protein, partial [Pseudomonadota bacterium]|nr:SPOR domain-containing protein [Pseudomonadota bacterium]